MINQKSLTAVEHSTFGKHFRKPLYDSYCFSNIPQTVLSLLVPTEKTVLPKDSLEGLEENYDKVVLFLIDGFGWEFFNRYKEKYPFLKRIIDSGVASKLTTQFPSTTSAQVTTIHSGQTVGQHGLYEWFYYEPKVDRIIAPLLFSFAGDKERETLLKAGMSAADIVPTPSIYQQLADKGIPSFSYQSSEYALSPYSKAALVGATMFSYQSLPEALVTLKRDIENQQKGYFFFYFSKIDTMSHSYGPNSEEFEAEVDSFFTTLESVFYQKIKGKAGKTLFLMTADHGHSAVVPENTYFINKEIPEILPMLEKNKKGDYLVPAGSCRDFFLHIKKENLLDAKKLLEEKLSGKAEIHLVSELLEKGFFGPDLSEKFLGRVGNLVILGLYGEAIWWYEEGRFEQTLKGHHGGLTPEESETLLLAINL
ncbi:MAG TPA: alkaline phosphatase family protein [Patescibacteria group bacterium]|nr:alkaline phosphatase family protein [Patescibacteria group bacterium]